MRWCAVSTMAEALRRATGAGPETGVRFTQVCACTWAATTTHPNTKTLSRKTRSIKCLRCRVRYARVAASLDGETGRALRRGAQFDLTNFAGSEKASFDLAYLPTKACSSLVAPVSRMAPSSGTL